MNDASFRRAQAMYEAQLPPEYDDEDSPATLARHCAAEIRSLGQADATDPTVQRLLAEAADEVGDIDVTDCETGAEVADAIDVTADAWEEMTSDPGHDDDDLYERTGRWSL